MRRTVPRLQLLRVSLQARQRQTVQSDAGPVSARVLGDTLQGQEAQEQKAHVSDDTLGRHLQIYQFDRLAPLAVFRNG